MRSRTTRDTDTRFHIAPARRVGAQLQKLRKSTSPAGPLLYVRQRPTWRRDARVWSCSSYCVLASRDTRRNAALAPRWPVPSATSAAPRRSSEGPRTPHASRDPNRSMSPPRAPAHCELRHRLPRTRAASRQYEPQRSVDTAITAALSRPSRIPTFAVQCRRAGWSGAIDDCRHCLKTEQRRRLKSDHTTLECDHFRRLDIDPQAPAGRGCVEGATSYL